MFESISKSESNKSVENYRITRVEFDNQLDKVKKIETEKGSIEYSVVEPEVLNIDTPVLFIGGFSQGKEVYTEEMFDLASAGRKVIFSNPLRGLERDVDSIDVYESVKEEFNLSDTVMNKVSEVEAILDAESASKIDLIGHSQGGVVATVLTRIRPDLVSNLVLQNSESFQGNDSNLKATAKFVYMIAAEAVSNTKQAVQGDARPLKAFGTVIKSFTKEMLRDPLWKPTKEVSGSVQVDIFPILEAVKKERLEKIGEGPHITMLTAYSDTLSDFSKRDNEPLNDDQEGLSKYIDTWAMYARKEAGHPAPTIELPGLLKQVIY